MRRLDVCVINYIDLGLGILDAWVGHSDGRIVKSMNIFTQLNIINFP